jgi:hypothetical protein
VGRRLGADKDTEKLIRAARKCGWSVTVTGGNHLKFCPPGGGRILFGALTGCGPGQRKLKFALMKAGVS